MEIQTKILWINFILIFTTVILDVTLNSLIERVVGGATLGFWVLITILSFPSWLIWSILVG